MTWKDIKGYEGLYQISEFGEIRLFNSKVLSTTSIKSTRRYRSINLTKNKTTKYKRIHHLVYENFIGEINDNFVIDHIDENRNNNHYTNLQQITQKENIIKHYKHRANCVLVDNTKKCRCCNLTKNTNKFYLKSSKNIRNWNPDKWRTYCIECTNKKRKSK